MSFENIKELEDRNKELAQLISNSEHIGNFDETLKLKRELFTNKLAMIDMITTEEKRNGITATELRKLVASKPNVPRYELGITPLDEALHGGIELGSFIQLAGSSGAGKTYLTLEVLSNVVNYSKAVFFNFEMSDTRIIKRLNTLLSNEEQWNNLIIDNDSREITALCNEITLHARDGIKFFVIDSKMKIYIKNERLADHQKFSMITKELSRLAQKLDVVVFLINQISEDDLKTKRLAFKGSGDQMYDSDLALFYVLNDDGLRTLICAKNRQDDNLFAIPLELNARGRTVLRYEAGYTSPVNKTSQPIPIIYEEKMEMGLVL